MDNKEVLNKIKKEFLLTNKKKSVKLPSDIEFIIFGESIKIKLSQKAVLDNMQKDHSAFEGWALVLKRWGKFEKVQISWEKPENVNNGHYQRFLFRVINFTKDFNQWFSIEKDSLKFTKDSKIKESGKYILNLPSKRLGEGVKQKPEAELEKSFVDGELKDSFSTLVNAEYLDRQLPIGLFSETISKNNSIFTGGASAIDIWGINKANELLVFELKAEKNSKVGILTELYFYVSVLQKVRNKEFFHDKLKNENVVLSRIADTKKLNAFFLAPSLHPLIDAKLISLLNNNSEVVYQNIQLNNDGNLTLNTFN